MPFDENYQPTRRGNGSHNPATKAVIESSAGTMKIAPVGVSQIRKTQAQKTLQDSNCSPISNLVALQAKLGQCLAAKCNLVGQPASPKEMNEIFKEYVKINTSLMKFESSIAPVQAADDEFFKEQEAIQKAALAKEQELKKEIEESDRPLNPQELARAKLDCKKSLKDRI